MQKKGMKRKELTQKNISEKKRLREIVFVLWPNSLEQLSS